MKPEVPGSQFGEEAPEPIFRSAVFLVCTALALTTLIGCGGGSEDFGKPPAAIANKKPSEPEPAKSNGSEAVKSGNSDAASATSSPSLPEPSASSGAPSAAVPKEEPKTVPEMADAGASSDEGATGLFGLAAAGDSGAAKKPDTGAAKPGTTEPLFRPALAADVSQDGDVLFVEAPGGRVAVYETSTRKLLGTWTSVEPDVLQIVYDDMTQKVAAVLPSGKIQVWQYRSVEGLDRHSRDLLWNYPEVSLLDGHPGGTNDLAFSPSRHELVSVGDDGVLRVWNTDEGSTALTFEESAERPSSFACSESGEFIVGTGNKELIVWEVASRKIVRRRSDIEGPVSSLKLYGPGLIAIVGTSDGSVIQVNLLQDEPPQRTAVFASAVADVELNEVTREITAVSTAGEIRRWKSDLPQTTRLEDAGTSGPLAISHDLRRLAFQTKASIRVRDVSETAQTPPTEISLSAVGAVEHAEFLDDGRLVTAGPAGWTVASESSVVASGSSGSPIRCLETSGNQLMFTADEAGRIVRWRVSSGRTSKADLAGKVTAVSDAISSGLIVLATDSGSLVFFDLNRATVTERFQVPNETIVSIAMADRERLFVGTSGGRVLRVQRDGDPIPVGEFTGKIVELRFAADEQSLFVRTDSGQAGACRITGNPSAAPRQTVFGTPAAASQEFVPVTAILPNTKGLMAACKDGTVQLWDPWANSTTALLKHDKPIICLNADSNGVNAEFVDSDGRRFRFTIGQNEVRPEALDSLTAETHAWKGNSSIVLYSSGSALVASMEIGDEKARCLQQVMCPDEIIGAGLVGQSQAYAVAPSGMVRIWAMEAPVLLPPNRKDLTELYCLAENRLIGVAEGMILPISGESVIPPLKHITMASRSPDRRTLTFVEDGSRATVTDGASLRVIGTCTVSDACRLIQSESTGRFLMLQTDERSLIVRDLKNNSLLHRYATDADLADVVMMKSDQIFGILADGSLRKFSPSKLDPAGQTAEGQRTHCLVPKADALLCFKGLELTLVGFNGTNLWKCPGPVANGSRVACSRNGHFIGALTTIDGKPSLAVWNQTTKSESRIAVPQEAEQLMFDSTGRKVTVLSRNECVTWQLPEGRQLATMTADAQALVSVGDDSTVFAARGTRQLLRTVSRRLAEVQAIDHGALSVAYSDSGDVIAVGGTDGLLHFLKRGARLAESGTLTAGSPVRQIVYSGRVVIARSDQSFLHCWILTDPETPLGAVPTEISQPGQVSHIELDSRQEFLMTAHPPSDVSVWYLNLVPGPPRQVITFEGRSSAAVAGSILPEQRRLVVIDANANVSVSPLADIDELRQSTFKAITQSLDPGELSEVPKTSDGRVRKGNDLLTQQLELQNRVRQAQLEKRSRSQLPFSRNPDSLPGAEQLLVSMERARASQLLTSVETGGSSRETEKRSDAALPAGLTLALSEATDAGSGPEKQNLAAAYQKMNDLRPIRPIKADNAAADPSVITSADGLARSIRDYVESQKAFVRQLQSTAVETAVRNVRGSGKAGDVRDILLRRLEQISDNRSIQTISTDFEIPEDSAVLSPVCLRVSRDGNTIISAYPSVAISNDEQIPGRIDIWDMVSGVSLKQFETTRPVRGLMINDSESRILTVPEVIRYELFEPTPAVHLFEAVFEVSTEPASCSMAGLARRTIQSAQGEILQLVDRETLEPLKLPMPESFDAETTALAFGHEAPLFAFAVSEQQKTHKLFICSPEDLSRFESIVPIDQFEARSDSAGGFLALTFSADDRQLAVLVEDPQKDNELLLRILEQKNGRWVLTSSTSLKGTLQASGSVNQRPQMRFTGSKNRIAILTDSSCLIGDLGERKSKTPGLWRIPFSSRADPSALSDDGRWLARGTAAGQISLFDLTSAYPDVAVGWPVAGDAAHDGPVAAISFSSTVPGAAAPVYLASLGLENRIKIWSLLDLEHAVKEQHLAYRKAMK
ncbi:MAG: WD40 repeat domain-containing protein [Planctomycetaceae bacterium]